MVRNLEKLFREASDLPETKRAELGGVLVGSDRDEGVEAAWTEEIERRVRQIESGEVKTIPWAEVRRKLYARLNQES